MTYDKEFLTWWDTNDSAFYSSQPASYRSTAMKDLAYQAWLAGQQSGIENGRELEREMSNTENNRYFH